jgi:hypothetical protein
MRRRSFPDDDGGPVIRSSQPPQQTAAMGALGDLGSAVLGGLYTYRLAALGGGLVALIVVAVVARRRGWLAAIRRHPRAGLAIVVPLVGVALPIGWYLASPLVLSSSIDEAPPVIAAAPSAGPGAGPTGVPSGAPPSDAPVVTAARSSAPAVPLVARSGAFNGSDEFHFGRGTARLLEVAPGSFIVRLEDFAVRNGPDLYVYLSPSARGYADGAIELGRLKADTGNQNYAVPAGALADPARAASVVIWCRQFSHLFATAPLGA